MGFVFASIKNSNFYTFKGETTTMKEVIRENIHSPYGLHDMNVIAFDIRDNDLIMKMQSGMVKVSEPCVQVDGHVEFHDVDWDFCFVYIFDGVCNTGKFSGEKMMFKDFVRDFKIFGFSIIDEVYGYNQTKYWGYLSANGKMGECIIEIYHAGDMVFVDEREFESMREVILSADDKVKIYSVPEEVADDLDKYCWDFAANWIWHGPENAKFLQNIKGQFVAVYGVSDFIDYLNRWAFPQRPSTLIEELDCYDYELPEEYKDYPQYNF